MNAMYDLVNDDNMVIGRSWKCKVARPQSWPFSKAEEEMFFAFKSVGLGKWKTFSSNKISGFIFSRFSRMDVGNGNEADERNGEREGVRGAGYKKGALAHSTNKWIVVYGIDLNQENASHHHRNMMMKWRVRNFFLSSSLPFVISFHLLLYSYKYCCLAACLRMNGGVNRISILLRRVRLRLLLSCCCFCLV